MSLKLKQLSLRIETKRITVVDLFFHASSKWEKIVKVDVLLKQVADHRTGDV